MHNLTSSIFLPAYMSNLSPPHRRLILHTYLIIVMITALSRGRPHFNTDLIMSYNPYPIAPRTGINNSKGEFLSDPSNEKTRNAWLSLVESSLYAEGDYAFDSNLRYPDS